MENIEQIDIIKDRLNCYVLVCFEPYKATESVAGGNAFGERHEFSVTGWYEGGAVHVWVEV